MLPIQRMRRGERMRVSSMNQLPTKKGLRYMTPFQKALTERGCYIDPDLMGHLDDGHTALLNSALEGLEHALLRCAIHIDNQVPGELTTVYGLLGNSVEGLLDNYKDLLDDEPESEG